MTTVWHLIFPRVSDKLRHIYSSYPNLSSSSRYISLEDLLRFMKEDDAWKVIDQFEAAAERKRISKSSLKNWLVSIKHKHNIGSQSWIIS